MKSELPVPSVSSVAWKEENSHDRGLKLAVKQEHPVQHLAPDELAQRPVSGIALWNSPHQFGSSPKPEIWVQGVEESLVFFLCILGNGE